MFGMTSSALPTTDVKLPAPSRGGVRPADGFVQSERVNAITQRANAYLEAGYPVHLSGPAGTGKTTLAFHIAAMRNRPVSLIHGNDAHNGTDLVGRDDGYRRSTTVDNFIHSVVKTEENVDVKWTDNPLKTAVERGHTLIYDEFNRTRAEANNVLLSLLEEGILSAPRGGYIRVHPDFRIILTSNPGDYAGVHRAQNALIDRLITIQCGHYDAFTEESIVRASADIGAEEARRIVQIVRSLRGEFGDREQPTIRAAIAIARVLRHIGAVASADDSSFIDVAWDVLGDSVRAIAEGERPVTRDEFESLVTQVLGTESGEPRIAA